MRTDSSAESNHAESSEEEEFDNDFIYNPLTPLAIRLEPIANLFRRFYAIRKNHRKLLSTNPTLHQFAPGCETISADLLAQENHEQAWLNADSQARSLAIQQLSIVVTDRGNRANLWKHLSKAVYLFYELQEREGKLEPAVCNDLAGVYTIWACQEFYEAGYHSYHLSRAQISSRALQLWSEVHSWGPYKGKTLLEINTSRLFEDLGIRVKSGYPNGRPTKESFPPGIPEPNQFIWPVQDFKDLQRSILIRQLIQRKAFLEKL